MAATPNAKHFPRDVALLPLAAVLTLLCALGGCAHISRLDLQDYRFGREPLAQAEGDAALCAQTGVDAENLNPASDSAYRYNLAYAACMKKKGYVRDDLAAGFDSLF